jgi:hypothetical protein
MVDLARWVPAPPPDGSVTTAKLADDAVTAAKIAADAIGASEILADAVAAAEIATDAVNSAEIAAAAVRAAELGVMPGALVRRTAVQALASGVQAAVGWDAEVLDTDGMHDNAANNSRLTIVTAGLYLILGKVTIDNTAAGRRELNLRLNGATFLEDDHAPGAAGANCSLRIAHLAQLAATDFLELLAFQDSGAALNVQAGERASFFGAFRLAA